MITDARNAVLLKLAERYEHFAEEEQVLVAEGRYAESQGAHEYARLILRAYRNETDEPKTVLPDHKSLHHTPIPGCDRCGRVL